MCIVVFQHLLRESGAKCFSKLEFILGLTTQATVHPETIQLETKFRGRHVMYICQHLKLGGGERLIVYILECELSPVQG
jgi:hypothetical protein